MNENYIRHNRLWFFSANVSYLKTQATCFLFKEFTCSTCGSGFIEEIAEADDSRDLGQGGSSDDPWAHDTETDGDQEVGKTMNNM